MSRPVIAESLKLILSMVRKGTLEKFIKDRMSKYSPHIFKTSLLEEPTAVILCGAPRNKFLFSNENKLGREGLPFFSPNFDHRRINGVSKTQALQKYIGTMDWIAKQHLETNRDFKEVTVFSLAKRYTFTIICRLFLRIKNPNHIAKFADPFHVLASGVILIPINFPETPFNRAIRAADMIRKEVVSIIKQRENYLSEKKSSSSTHDILSHMLTTSTDENELFIKEMDIADKILLGLLIGGHDIANAAISFIMKYLAESSNVYNELLKEQIEIARAKQHVELLNWDDLQNMKYSWNVANEVTRLAPPLQGNFLEAIADFTFAGFSIPKGWRKLYWSANSTHKNPAEFFPNLEKFDPSKGLKEMRPSLTPYNLFLSEEDRGPRLCPGKEYDQLEIFVFIHNVRGEN